uniref:Uncharacterized protein n=2 Tax=Lotharella globosa TaxID=91324 RepID=A0A6V3IXN4_9EUKA|mmetsp:Transcript_15048/g.30445  ORF Transcript_15048/g.30445 Transcript_15048/m.30445 type:complete len:114 (+) Transcript_15048:353-694(+)
MPMQFPVGILRPNWLENATYLRTETVDLYNCNVWTKADGFITYWEDVNTHKPVKWIFGSGMEEHVMKWIVNETLPDDQWSIPDYCNNGSSQSQWSSNANAHFSMTASLARVLS